MTSRPRPVCQWCGRSGQLGRAQLDGRQLVLCEACRRRLRRALDGDPASQFMLRALRKAGDR